MPSSAHDSESELVAAIGDAATLWELTCALLRHWRVAGSEQTAWRSGVGDVYFAWGDIVLRVQQWFSGPRAPDDLDEHDRRFLLDVTARGGIPDAVHAAAWGLSTTVSHTFAPAWRDALGGGRHTLRPGEFYPVADAPWILPGVQLSPRPASLTPPAHGELPTVRVFGDEGFDVTVDFTLGRTLEAVALSLDRVAAAHPNDALDELDLPETVPGQIFPVGPKDPAAQRELLVALVTDALNGGAPVTVLPELSVRAEDLDALQELVIDHDGPCLVVAGSHHKLVGGVPQNVAVGLVSGHEARMIHHKVTPFWDELGLRQPTKEGIPHRARPHLVVHQADRFRVGLAVCKELLDARVTRALDRMGVNLLLVPALSAKTAPFEAACSARAAGAQALTVVVNGPLRGTDGTLIEPAVVVGQPVDGATAVPVTVAGPAPCLVWVDVPALPSP